jgi:hypothetical protein
MERWFGLGRLLFVKFGMVSDQNFATLERWLPEEIVVEDVGAADTAMRIRHSLGRVPRGLEVINQVVPSGTEPVAWYRVEGDEAWTGTEVVVRWTVTSARVVVRVW